MLFRKTDEMAQPKPILLVCGCKKYEEYLHAAMRRFTHDAWTLVGLVADPTLTAPNFDETTRILTVATPDTYEALPQKIHAAFAWVHATYPDAPGVFKTDDDIIVGNLNDLVGAITSFTATPFWGFAIHQCMASYVSPARIANRFCDKSLRPKHQTAYYCFGHGYWLSAQALKTAVSAGADYATSFLEDVCTGYVLNRVGIIPARVPIAYRELPRGPELLRYTQ